MQRLEDIFARATEAVLSVSGLSYAQLFTCRSERCVTARVVLVDALVQIGCTESDIVTLSGMSQQRVNSLKNSARYRLKGLAARIMKEEVEKILHSTLSLNIAKD